MKELFRIKEISDGWFEAVLCGEYELTCSDLWLCDPPRELLKALSDIADSDSRHFISFKGEPGAEIVEFSSNGNEMKICLYYTSFASESLLPDSGEELEKYCEDVVFFEVVRKDLFIENVIKEFDRFSDAAGRHQYEKEWDRFPISQFERLKSKIE